MIKQTDPSQGLQEFKAFGIRRFGLHWNKRMAGIGPET
jgi:hypothetical protein